MWKKVLISLLFAFCSAGCSKSCAEGPKIAIDPTWGGVDFGANAPYVNGFVEELLLTLSQKTGLCLVKIETNRDDLYEGLRDGRYALALTPLPQLAYTVAKYDFSPSVLEMGVIAFAQKGTSYKKIDDFRGKIVGWVEGDTSSWTLLQGHPEVSVRSYESLPLLLEAVARGEAQGGLYARLPTMDYLEDLYSENLLIAAGPLTSEGLHFIALKGDEKWLPLFIKEIKKMKKGKKLQALQEKWMI